MPGDSEFFEESAELLNSPDRVVARTSHALYREMAKRYRSEKLGPADGFNTHYLFDSVSRTLKRVYFGTPEEETNRAPIYGQIRAINFEDGSCNRDMIANERALGMAYLSLVKSESSPQGSPFDMRYALEIVTSALNGKVLEWILGPTKGEYPFEREEQEFDEWLAGFNDRDRERKSDSS